MPVDVDSDAWKSADEHEHLEPEVLDFLIENGGEAFVPREISDELGYSDWMAFEEQYQRLEEMSREERMDADKEDYPTVQWNIVQERILRAVAELTKDGHVEARRVPAEEFVAPYAVDDEGTITAFAYTR